MNYLETEPTTERASSPPEELHMFALEANSSQSRPIYCDVLVKGTPLTMEVETTRKSLFPESKLAKTNVVLKMYTHETIPVLGELTVEVHYGTQTEQLSLVVVAGEGPSLLGRNWLKSLRLDWQQIGKIALEGAAALNALLERHKAVLKDDLGTVPTPQGRTSSSTRGITKVLQASNSPLCYKRCYWNGARSP